MENKSKANLQILNSSSPVIAVPISQMNNNSAKFTTAEIMEDDYYNNGTSNVFSDDAIELSGNFFSQLDSMIAAVKMESSALDSMKEKLKEVDGLKLQLNSFNKRLLDADQNNLNLKNQIIKAQEAMSELKKLKEEAESNMVPLRQELNRVKDVCNKERSARLSAQQEVAMLKEQLQRLEKSNEALDRECKTIPALNETNEIMKNDLIQLRKRFKEDKNSMMKHIKRLESQSQDVNAIKNEVQTLSMRLLEISSNGINPGQGVGVTSSVPSPGPNAYHNSNMYPNNEYPQGKKIVLANANTTAAYKPNHQQGSAKNSLYYQNYTYDNDSLTNPDMDPDDAYDLDDDGALGGDEDEDTFSHHDHHESFVDEGVIDNASVTSVQSVGTRMSQQQYSPASLQANGQVQQGIVLKERKKKKVTAGNVGNNRSQQQQHIVQSNSNSGKQQPSPYHHGSSITQQFSLPRIG